jgi:septal ring factor EnvC (AmiA/AmiB activator)
MSDRVNELIEEIRGKANSMKDRVSTEQDKNNTLTKEIEELKTQLSAKEAEVSQLKGELDSLKSDISSKNEQSIAVASDNGVSDEQIDELVKEIEYCITQLKR